jgi:hypothetical protein
LAAEHSGPIPRPLLHFRKIERDSDVSVSIADDASTASTIRANNRTCRDSPCSVPLVETVPETAALVAPPLHDDALDMFALHDDASAVSCGCGAPGTSSCACLPANDTNLPCLPCAENEPTTTDLPFQCDCCQMELPQDDVLSSSIAE